ncbi:MAG: RNA methyltransferase [candidate division Zixibacteria bacterium]|nr:RNA methyltransferase [candidate division Zixibacteria bacterium]
MSLTKTEIKYLVSLQNKKGRRNEKRFLCEGVRLLEEALDSGYFPKTVFYSPADISDRGKKLIEDFTKKKVRVQTVSIKEINRLSDTKAPQGIVALFEMRNYSLEKQLHTNHRNILVCDNIGDPGNLGTLLRSAVAFDISLIITTDGSAELANPKTIRASMGAFFKLPFIENVNDELLVDELKANSYKIYNADVKGKYISETTPKSEQSALVIGSEAIGTGKALTESADYRIKIPISKKAESLNAAMAGTVLMFWMNLRERAKK